MLRSTVLAAAAVLCLAAASAEAQCPRGQEINADTAGNCCWPGQAFSKSRNACIGIPLCPPGYDLQGESCRRAGCPEGQGISEDTADHCCWPGQVWSNSKSRCVGVPQTCPGGRAPLGEDCAPTQCLAGQVRLKEGACCWPGQTWWAERTSCVGTPTRCPAGTTATPEGCFSGGWSGLPGTPAVGPEEAPGQSPAAGPVAEEAPWVAPPLLQADSGAPPVPVVGAPTPVAGAPITIDERGQPAEPPPPPGPKRSRTTLAAGLLLNDGYAGALALRVRVGLMSIMADSPFKGTLGLLIEPWLWLGGKADRTVTFFRMGFALNLGVGWEQRLGPVELTPRVGVFNGFTYRTLTDTVASAFSFNYEFKGVFGVTAAVPAGDGAKFVAGFDAYVGNVPLYFLSIGVVF